MDIVFVTTISAIGSFAIGIIIGFFTRKLLSEAKVGEARTLSEQIISEAQKESDSLRKEAILEAKDEIFQLRSDTERDLRERRNEIKDQEQRLLQREEVIDRKQISYDKRESSIEQREQDLLQRKEKITQLEKEATTYVELQQRELERISMISSEEGRGIILNKIEGELSHEIAVMIRDAEQQAKRDSDKKAKEILSTVIQRYAGDHVADTVVSVVPLPNDEMKGRIIGREGRNIRALETLTGIDLIIDDTPEAVILSGFDPIRREIARIVLGKLVLDGRIHPARIEEIVDKTRKEIEFTMREIGEQALFELGLNGIHPDLIKFLGRLHYRTSYGQNMLKHSIEVAHLAGMLASELGEDVTLAKRAGLLHDIGKAVDHELEGSHVEIGADLAKKYNESEIIVNAIESHHGDKEPLSLIATLVATADTLSAARPGARSETLEKYIRRLEKLEEISESFTGVERCFAVQAGREIRIVVKPEEINDFEAQRLARSIRKRIESELQYPGHIKVTVIRETRVVEYAK